MPALVALALVVAGIVAQGDRARPAEAAAAVPASRPNIVVVMTDDQNMATLETLADLPSFATDCPLRPGRIMPCVDQLLASRGVTFARHTAAYPLCCPSRATYISGQFSHNNNVRANFQYDNLDKERVLPVWLQRAGYATGYVGKYQGPSFFGWGHPDHPAGVPLGWDGFWGLVDAQASAYNYYGYALDANGVPEPHGNSERDYQTDVLTSTASRFIEGREASDAQPFFLSVGYVAPHWALPQGASNDPDAPGSAEGDPAFEAQMAPPVVAPRHLDELSRFREAALHPPRSPAFDEADVSDKPAFVRNRRPLTEGEIERIDRWFSYRLASLLAVDEGVQQIVETLRSTGELKSTYILFTADNGWLEGEHRLAFQKSQLYEESSRIPMIVFGPQVARGARVREATSNVDWAATVLDLAGAEPDAGFELDGMSLAPYLNKPRRRLDRVVFHETVTDVNTGAEAVAARLGRWKLIEHGTGELELYNLRRDRAETRSLHAKPSMRPVIKRLSGLLERFRTCHGQTGENPCLVTGEQPPSPDR
jgi:arylsulfatase A-like enzyme